MPQVAVRWPGRHLSPSQQPLHEAGVQVHVPLTQAWLPPHTEQAAPPPPQAAAVLPGTHCPLLSQQPVGQVVAPQVMVDLLQLLLVHASSLPQLSQIWPPLPQAASLLPGWQLPFLSQHPLGQVAALQATALHALLTHFSPFLHAWQAAPPLPHTPGLSPGMQVLLKQQPPGQVAGPQGLGWHAPSTQRSSASQRMHALPPRPHACSLVAVMHVEPWQQPPEQVVGPHGSAVHVPLMQRSPGLHVAQGTPPTPQVAVLETDALTSTQIPAPVQQPAQVPTPHDPPSSPHPATNGPQAASSAASRMPAMGPPRPVSFGRSRDMLVCLRARARTTR